jgi:FkbH-like protein
MNGGTDQRNLLRKVADLGKQCRPGEALRLLSSALRQDALDAEGCERAGRLISKLRASSGDAGAPVRAALLGQCTTSWIAASLVAEAWGRGCCLEVKEGEYDNVIQELTGLDHRPHVIILLPWNQRLLHGGGRSTDRRVADELDFWKRAWDLVGERTGARILQAGYDWVGPGALGHHLSAQNEGEVGLIRRTNEELRRALPSSAFFLDLEQVSGIVGRDRFYDPRRYFWTKQPFSETGARCLARQLWAGIRALLMGPKKVLVVDLDNTLWGGVVGETGQLGIALGETPDGEAYRAFQRYLKNLSQRGIVLAVCSKNNREDALAPFQQNPQMIVELHDFACLEASWQPKSEGLRRIAASLNLGLDSFVFFDDNPAEREHIRQALPEVEVVEVPEDPADYIRALEVGLWFETVQISAEDTQRSAHYQQESYRREAQRAVISMGDYLTSLEMRGTVQPISSANLQRVVQLIGKTNQFNLTTRRHSERDVENILSQPGSLGLALTLEDKFGDHGLISVLLAVPMADRPEKALYIDTWLMSCRVIGRTAEEFFFNELSERARELGYKFLRGEFIPTRKNALVCDLYDRLGCERIAETAEGSVIYRYALWDTPPPKAFIAALHGVATPADRRPFPASV